MKSIKDTIIVILAAPSLFVLPTGSSFANGDAPARITRSGYNLNFASDRADQPYLPLENANRELTDFGRGSEYPVNLSRHHIIPLNTLVAFYNKIVSNGELEQFKFFNSFAVKLSSFAANVNK
ncbi:hypothetical protein HED49_01545 [Ochrobactrum daejeonense]|nr:hypothetical protein [Brucella daejeonensis]